MHNRYVHFLLTTMRLCKPTVWIILKNVFCEKIFIQSWKSIYIMFWYIQPWNRLYMCEWTSRFYYCTLSTDFRLGMILYGSPYNISPCILSDVYWLILTVCWFWERNSHTFNVSKFTPNSPVKCEIATILISKVYCNLVLWYVRLVC